MKAKHLRKQLGEQQRELGGKAAEAASLAKQQAAAEAAIQQASSRYAPSSVPICDRIAQAATLFGGMAPESLQGASSKHADGCAGDAIRLRVSAAL